MGQLKSSTIFRSPEGLPRRDRSRRGWLGPVLRYASSRGGHQERDGEGLAYGSFLLGSRAEAVVPHFIDALFYGNGHQDFRSEFEPGVGLDALGSEALGNGRRRTVTRNLRERPILPVGFGEQRNDGGHERAFLSAQVRARRFVHGFIRVDEESRFSAVAHSDLD